MKELLIEYSEKYIDNTIKIKIGYCQRCLSEKWTSANQKKKLYSYEFNKDEIYVCSEHIGCLEIAKVITEDLKEMNDIEKRRYKNGLNKLIKEGELLK